MLRVLIIEDNLPIRNALLSMMGKPPGVFVAGTCSTVAAARVLLTTTAPDLVLLDIELEDGTAFDLLSGLPEISFKIIFITAYNEHAIKAVKLGALDYLLKPIDEAELMAALEKAGGAPRQSGDQISVAHQHMMSADGCDRIVLKEHNIIRVVPRKEVLYCQSNNGYTLFFLTDGRKITVSRSVKEYEKLLPSFSFIRVHNSYIVNLEHVELYHREGYLVLKGGIEVPVSTRKREEVIKVLTHH
ncbi:LytR/AlgR family response regulator transcription factor [Taibaiella koreensis]|uniref:LytR/AlgR family response regulator transcription factor n=1 Tax=Taibaiella koreensis TaxID=1268548 RepID=UPI000E59E45E|nr:LytTR family DNA-binding domain-containing protein [Taibaiella koreensis]